ncbi:GDSL esterase/lipase At3g43550-like [Brassica napus]|uniref:GDSL esterase/lipase At3g43550-like n=1 Tax=Brassica napus TaxID=3708 RepID=UPI00207AD75E|nr:GDSL esterase/lipase At3g43550-like [Brassica napus]
MDTGNNNGLHTILKCNFPPYGKDFPGGYATGRFSDGRVPSDLIAEKLGLTKTLPAYMSPNLKPEDLLQGVTFASGGTGYDPLTAKMMLKSRWSGPFTITDVRPYGAVVLEDNGRKFTVIGQRLKPYFTDAKPEEGTNIPLTEPDLA